MNMRNVNGAANSGFTLIEAMIALVVLSFGLLAIAQFQSKLVTGSAYNKARSEAIALAQEKLDQLRNYGTEPEQVALLNNTTPTAGEVFPDNVVNNTYPATAQTIQGVNATFSRQWTVGGNGDARDVSVIVTWNDPHKGPQSVTLNTDMTWKNPRATADLGVKSDQPVLPSATGAATLGDGTYTGTIPDSSLNNDGTATLQNGADNVLVDVDSSEIVLTLKNACDTESGVCTDFVKITGRVYIDQVSGSRLSPDNIKVLASDAAYCATKVPDPHTTTPNGDYEYFDYTCYLGGGWYGNIGLLLVPSSAAGASNSITDADRVCLGDPNASALDGAEAWKRVQLAKRRVYRGMLYQIDAHNNAVLDPSNEEIIKSVGIKDAAELPDTTTRTDSWDSGEHKKGHDYVVTHIVGSGVNKTNCVDPLTRADSASGTLFTGVPTDFLCLNSDSTPNDGAFDYLDYFDTTNYAAHSDCPYNPASPPSVRYEVTGMINGNQDLTGINMMTSDGTDNCTVTPSGNNATYVCNVYDWGSGWVGAVYLDNASGPALTCDIDPAMFVWDAVAPLFNNTSGHDLTCWAPVELTIEGSLTLGGAGHKLDTTTMATSDGTPCTMTLDPGATSGTYSCTVMAPGNGSGWNGSVTITPPAEISCSPATRDYPVLTNSVTGDNYDCVLVNYPTTHLISGSLSGPSLNLTGATVSASDASATCSSIDASGGYSCTVTDIGAGWLGTISVTSLPSGTVCTDSTHDYTVSTVNSDMPGEDFNCSTNGVVTVKLNIYMADPGSTSPNVTMDSGFCWEATSASTTPGTATWECRTSPITAPSTWSGNVTVTSSNNFICTGTSTTSSLTQHYDQLKPKTIENWDVRIESNAASCP